MLPAAGAPRPRLAAGATAALALLARGAAATESYSPETRILSAHLYGNLATYGYYFVDLLVGTPSGQRASVIVDTGSRLMGFACTGCQHCGEHIDRAFNVSHSATAAWVRCGDETCTAACSGERCSYAETYSEGSSISGVLFEDFARLGDSEQANPAVRVQMGCNLLENSLFYSQAASGIMGLAPGAGSSPTVLTQLFSDTEHVRTSTFSLCFATWGGRLTIGGYNSSYHRGGDDGGGIQWVRLRPERYHFVFPVGLTIGDEGDGRGLAAAWGQEHLGVSIVDSGTTYSYFPQPLYAAILEQIGRYCGARGGCSAGKSSAQTEEGSECWQLSAPELEPVDFPTLRIFFDQDTRVDWHPLEYLQKRDSSGIWCATFLPDDVFQTVLGTSFMLHRDVIFDLDGGRLGFAKADCPEHRRPPTRREGEVDGHAVAKPLPQRLYSVDSALAAQLGYRLGAEGARHQWRPRATSAVALATRRVRWPVAATALLAVAGLLSAAYVRLWTRTSQAPEGRRELLRGDHGPLHEEPEPPRGGAEAEEYDAAVAQGGGHLGMLVQDE
ncbi:unnamed protein product [Prorocentrum cordatum]|uniref:Peptidase A1 domain-containing protein n=1 Tax=Prorocentrum cordatum TaxID=2364126 RepID=A0ABN9V110_9DINO|nr:unnamed protein product [Polarella glacialis]